MKTVLYAKDIMSFSDLQKTLKKLKKQEKFGFYIEATEFSSGKFAVELYGPKIYWRRKTVWEIANANAPRVSN